MRYVAKLVPAVLLAAFMFRPPVALAQIDLIKVLVTTPSVEMPDYSPLADVMAGSLIRELTRAGGMEVMPRDTGDNWLAETGRTSGISDRSGAWDAGTAVGADMVVFSMLTKRHDDFVYRIVLLEVQRNVVQRTLDGTFRITSSANEIGRLMHDETPKLVRYIPKRAEINDPAFSLRLNTVDPERLPPYAEITDLPSLGTFGYIEQIFSYFDVYPGETEYRLLNQEEQIYRLIRRDGDLDEQLNSQFNQYYKIGDFAIRHGLQAFMIENCSYRTINVLLANKIPVFVGGRVYVGYDALSLDGYSVLKTIDGAYVASIDLNHRNRMAAMFFTAKPGRYHGISKDYLTNAIGLYADEVGETPKLVEIEESMFDIAPTGWE